MALILYICIFIGLAIYYCGEYIIPFLFYFGISCTIGAVFLTILDRIKR